MADNQGWPGGAAGRIDASGLVRFRLTSRLADPATYRMARIVAPAGSGKSRLLAHAASAYPGPVGWCGSPDPVPRSEQALVEWFWQGLKSAVESPAAPGGTVEGLISHLGATSGPPVLLVADDMHLLESSDAETAFGELVKRVPERLRILMATRVTLGLDLSRLRVSGELVEIGPEDLRFRAWEVEELFRDIYGEPLIPEDVGALARRTGGWAAYLQLFHLATARKPQGERRRVLASLTNRIQLVHEYLARHVLAGLTPDLQDFLVRTSVLRRPTAGLADELLGWESGSREMLGELERRQLFTERIDDESYRYHSVLLSYLDAQLVETVGVGEAREQHRRGAVLLEREGFHEDAAAAYAKAEDWAGVARTMGHPQGGAAGYREAWLEALPPTVVETDSQLLMARARRALISGALAEAVATMRAAEAVAASAAVAERCRAERHHVLAWMEPGRATGTDWLGVLRAASQRHPRESQRSASALPGASGRFAEGASAFFAGDALSAFRILRGVASHPEAHPAMAAGARLLAMVAGTTCGKTMTEDELERIREEVEQAGIPWLDRMARVALAATGEDPGYVLDDVTDACQREGDRWGVAFATFMSGVSALIRRRPSFGYFRQAAGLFEELGAGVLETGAHAYEAVAALSGGDTETAIRAAQKTRTLASLLDVPGAGGVAALVLARSTGDDRELARAKELLDPLGTWHWYDFTVSGGEPKDAITERAAAAEQVLRDSTPLLSSEPARVEPPEPLPARLRCLGSFSLEINGRMIEESAAKPMERSLLHLLSMRAGSRIHREALIEALWPEADPEAGRHRLQVAVSSLRRLLSSDANGVNQLLIREGDSYKLALPAGAVVDIWQFDAALKRAASARAADDQPAELGALAVALDTYGGQLLPADGPADWVVDHRSTLQTVATDAAVRLASLRLHRGDSLAAADAARSGLSIDRYRDELWKLLIEAAEESGHHAEAGHARKAYAAVLEELGV